MNNKSFVLRPNRLQATGLRLVRVAAIGLVVALAMHASAADSRAIKTRLAPAYPEIAKRMRITGVVRLAVTVDAEGKVTDVKPLSGNSMLSAAAAEAVRKWRFEPGGESTEEVALNFNLQ